MVNLMIDAPKMQVLDLFSGIGGFRLGLERTGGFTTAAFCEINGFALNAASVPDAPSRGSMLRFDRATMKDIFEQGRALAEAGDLWRPVGSAAETRATVSADGV